MKAYTDPCDNCDGEGFIGPITNGCECPECNGTGIKPLK
jgi:DnaJ-class molecular chaperone